MFLRCHTGIKIYLLIITIHLIKIFEYFFGVPDSVVGHSSNKNIQIYVKIIINFSSIEILDIYKRLLFKCRGLIFPINI